jgi:hypothetical protein
MGVSIIRALFVLIGLLMVSYGWNHDEILVFASGVTWLLFELIDYTVDKIRS